MKEGVFIAEKFKRSVSPTLKFKVKGNLKTMSVQHIVIEKVVAQIRLLRRCLPDGPERKISFWIFTRILFH